MHLAPAPLAHDDVSLSGAHSLLVHQLIASLPGTPRHLNAPASAAEVERAEAVEGAPVEGTTAKMERVEAETVEPVKGAPAVIVRPFNICCILCFEELPGATQTAALPCAHECCAACLAAYLARAVPRAARTSRAQSLDQLLVCCPGLIPHDDGDATSAGRFDLRCLTRLPTALLVPYAPASIFAHAAHAPSSELAAARSSTTTLRTRMYLWLRCRRCAHCGAPSERVGGCRFVVCAGCGRDWCWACGSADPDGCTCALKYEVWRDMGSLMDGLECWMQSLPVSCKLLTLLFGFPLYLLVSILWLVPFICLTLAVADVIVDYSRPDLLVGLLAAGLADLHEGRSAQLCERRPARRENEVDVERVASSEWRQHGSVLCSMLRSVAAVLFCCVVSPLVAALWLAFSPLRFLCALTCLHEARAEDT